MPRYDVMSRATFRLYLTPPRQSWRVILSGRRFLPNTRLLLAAYPMFPGAKPVSLGVARSTSTGLLSFSDVTRKLVPGEYVLRVWSMDFLTVEMAYAYFQVVV